jgi:GNAT superfamily N-acetyltransferase
MAVSIVTNGPCPTQQLKALWDLVPWAQGRDPEAVLRAVQATQLMVLAWDEDRLVGSTRVITDGVYYATIWDVIVHPDYRAQGIGYRMVEAAVAPFRHRGFSYIALYSVVGVEPFYERLGFRRHPAGMRLDESITPTPPAGADDTGPADG